MAVQSAQQWAAKTETKRVVGQDRCQAPVVEGAEKDIGRYQGKYDYGDGRVEDYSNSILMKFWRDASHLQKPRCLVLTENIRWGYIPADTDVKDC